MYQPVSIFLLACSLLGQATAAQQDSASAKRGQRRRVEEKLPPGVEAHLDLVYAAYGSRKMRLDLFMPKDARQPLPAVVFVHGGGWFRGDKTKYRPMAQRLAARGYVTACIEYRLSGEVSFPAAIHDCKAAVRWLRANAGKYRVNPDKIGAVGGSAGGHLAGLMATTGNVPKLEGDGGNAGYSSAVQAAVVMAGPMNLNTPEMIERSRSDPQRRIVQFLGASYDDNPQPYKEASPMAYLGRSTPPCLFMDGENDRPGERNEAARKKLKELGIETDLIVLKDAPHPFWMLHPWFEPTLDDVDKFFSKTLKGP